MKAWVHQVDEVQRLHFPTGYAPAGRGKVRAACHCGWMTTPRVSRERARQALFDEHGFTGGGTLEIECGICSFRIPRWDHWSRGGPWPWEVFAPLMADGKPYVTPAAEGPPREVYVCRDVDACHARHEANRRADQLKCGCYQSSVMAIGHYHDTTAGAAPPAAR